MRNDNGRRDVGNSTYSAPVAVRLIFRRLFAFRVTLGRAGQDLLCNQAGVLANRSLDFGGHIRIGFQESLRVLAPLSKSLAVIGEPGPGFLDQTGLDAEIEDF